jgi:hypothetical protein
MTEREMAKKQLELCREESKTQKEKDIWNLKWFMCNISKGSHYYRMGMIGTLRRVIHKLEKKNYHA